MKIRNNLTKTEDFHFPNLDNSELAELIGILLGDGCLGRYECKTKDKLIVQHRIKITLHSKDDLIYVDYILDLFIHLFGIRPLVRFRKNENTVDILLFRKGILNFLLHDVGLILSPKWNRAQIPNMYMSDQFGRKVLRGYFDTDGCVTIMNNNGTRYPRLEMKICPSPMQAQLVHLLKENNFRFRVHKLDKGKITVHLCGKNELKKWYSDIGFSNPKNRAKAESFF